MLKRSVSKICSVLMLVLSVTHSFAACSKVSFKVKFIVDDSVYATIDTSGEEVLQMPNTPEKDGYTFAGWFCDNGTWEKPFSANSLLDAPLSSDMSVYAKFDAINYVCFGSYPQSKVTDSGLISTLNGLAGSKPASENSQNWTSYGYYISGNVQNYMWYIDLTSGSDRYRGVYFTSYRPYWCTDSSSTSDSYQDDNGYGTNTVYWFKYEPIKWTLLDETTGFILADLALDSQQYDYDGNYSNNYARSTIRKWLNENFYHTAFSAMEQELIKETEVDNSAESTGFQTNQFACENTNDKIFLLSYKEVEKYFANNLDRQKKSTDYAKSQGCWKSPSGGDAGNCFWWLRSPLNDCSYFARGVIYDGYFVNRRYVNYTDYGIVPALHIRLS